MTKKHIKSKLVEAGMTEEQFETAWKRHKEQGSKYEPKLKKGLRADCWLKRAFVWAHSKEGYEYWSEIFWSLKDDVVL